jgi:hypothetical protein
VLGGVAFIIACVILLLWVFLFRRRQKRQKRTKKLPTDIIDAEDDDDDAPRQNELPQNYQPEPFMIPIPEATPSEFDDEFSLSRPWSPGTRTSFYTRSETPDLASTLGVGGGGAAGGAALANGGSSGTGRKGGAPRPMRAVNIIQHHDAGPNNGDREEPVETIELPPAYTMVRSAGGSGGSGGPSSSADN